MQERARAWYERHLYNHWLAVYRAYCQSQEYTEVFLEPYRLENAMHLPPTVHEAYEWYRHQTRVHGMDTVQAFRVPLPDGDSYALYAAAGSGDGWIEIYDAAGNVLGAGRVYIELVDWGELESVRALLEHQALSPGLIQRQSETLWGKPLEELPPPEESALELVADDAALMTARMLDVMEYFFTSDNWSTMRDDESAVIRTAYSGMNGRWDCYTRVSGTLGQLAFYSLCPIYVPQPQRGPMAEFLTRANYGLGIGNFEMDMSDGEVRYKTSVDLEGVPLDKPWLMVFMKNLVYPNVLIMDRYLPGVLRVVSGREAPAEIIADIES